MLVLLAQSIKAYFSPHAPTCFCNSKLCLLVVDILNWTEPFIYGLLLKLKQIFKLTPLVNFVFDESENLAQGNDLKYL